MKNTTTNKRVFFITEVSTYLLLILISSSCSKKESFNRKVSPRAVVVTKIKSDNVNNSVISTGTVHSTDEIVVYSAIAGKIFSIPFNEGEKVKKGNVILKITAPEMTDRISKQLTERSRVESQKEFYCSQAIREKELYKKGAITKVQYDSSILQCDIWKKSLATSRSAITELYHLASKRVERSPVKGKIIKWYQRPGENVVPGKPVILVGNDKMEVRANFHESDVSKGIRVGMKAIVTGPGGESIVTKVKSVGNLATGKSRMVEIKLPLKNEKRFLHGMSMKVEIITEEFKKLFIVDEDSLFYKNGKPGVYLLQKDTLKWIEIKVSVRTDNQVGIKGNLSTDSFIIRGKDSQLSENLKVYPVYEGEKNEHY
ncbi:MAG: efflux RND transporter periplasmic adaptor subunit [Deltaproteobacteria bacterium]|nr:efflux RND transporter periplasmic adaptor subunit [Deltaproteobacteria bacterium]